MADSSVFECGLCWKEYDEKVHRPLSLPCGHVFCEECLRKCAHKDETQCPVHRSWFPSGIKDLPSCFAILVNLPRTRTRDVRCPAHPKRKLKFRCVTHKVNFCSDCVVMHSGHTVVALSDVTQRLISQLGELSESTKSRLSGLSETRRTIEQNEKNLAGFYDMQTLLVRKTYDDAISQLTSKKNELIQELKNQWGKQTRAFEIEKGKVATAIDRITENVSKLESMQSTLRTALSIDEAEALLDSSRKDLSRVEDVKPGEVVVFSFQESLRITDKSAVMRAKAIDLAAANCSSKECLRAPTRAFALEGQKNEGCKVCMKATDPGQRLCKACLRKCESEDPLSFSGRVAHVQSEQSKGEPTARPKEKNQIEAQPARHGGTPRSVSKPAKEVEAQLPKSPGEGLATRRRPEGSRHRKRSRHRSVCKQSSSF